MSIVIKKSFELLKGVDNLLELSPREIKGFSVENGQRLLHNVIEMTETSVEHFAKAKISKQIEKIEEIALVRLETYPLHVSYNIPTKQIVLNIAPFNIDTITAIRPDPRNIYAMMVYGICFRGLVTNKGNQLKDRYAAVFASYYTSMMIQMFGREYALLDKYSKQIPMLKYLISCYVLISFFGVERKQAYKMSRAISGSGPLEVESKLDSYDFTNIGGLIESLSGLEVLPGITKPLFMGKILKYMSVHFVPGLEDISRMIALSSATLVKGSNLVPGFIRRYNEDEYMKILELGRLVI